MMQVKFPPLLAILLLAMAIHSRGAVELTDDTYETWRDYVLPKEEELGYKAIPWRASYWEAVVEAQEKEMPILLWAMNGHPLACT